MRSRRIAAAPNSGPLIGPDDPAVGVRATFVDRDGGAHALDFALPPGHDTDSQLLMALGNGPRPPSRTGRGPDRGQQAGDGGQRQPRD